MMSDSPQPVDALIHITDVHFWKVVKNPLLLMNKRFWGNLTVALRRRHHFLMERAESHADAVAATGVKNVLLTGDFASTSTDDEFKRAIQFVEGLRSRGLALFVLPGNHDVYTFRAARTRRFERYFQEFLPSGGYPAHVNLPGGTDLILVPTVCPRHFSTRGYISSEEIENVGRRLESCGTHAIVAAHYPLIHETRTYQSRRFRRLENAERLRRVLGESGKRIVCVGGHVHRSSYERDTDYPNLEHLTTDAFFRTDLDTGSQGQFTEIRVFPDVFKLTRHVNKGEWSTIDVTPELSD